MQNEIEQALNNNVDLTEEEYKEKMLKADATTKAHNVEGRAPISEALRHKRVQTNFYASMLNIGVAILGALDGLAEEIAKLRDEVKNGKQ